MGRPHYYERRQCPARQRSSSVSAPLAFLGQQRRTGVALDAVQQVRQRGIGAFNVAGGDVLGQVGVQPAAYPAVQAWVERIATRPAVMRGLQTIA